MNTAPHCLDRDTLAADALHRLEAERISQIVVTGPTATSSDSSTSTN